MSELGLAAAWLLAVVFGWAAVAKARDPRGTAQAFEGLGLPVPRILARVLPASEAALAGLLLVRPAWGGAAALALLALFSGVLADRLRRGITAPCACLGGRARAPLSVRTLARNGVLAVVASAALAAGGPALPTLPALIAASTGALVGGLLLALVELRAETGRLVGLGPLPTLPDEPGCGDPPSLVAEAS